MKDAAYAVHCRIHGEGVCVPPCGLCKEVEGLIEDLLDEHAHELAEKQRKLADERGEYPSHYTEGVYDAADLIDPEVTS